MTPRNGHMVETAFDAPGDGALARLFAGWGAAPEVAHVSLAGGQVLYTAGQPADTLYFLKAGRLGVIREEPGREQQFLGVVKPGEPVGEMALIAGTPHSATVVAIRDSEILALPREAFFLATRRDPLLMAELAHLMIVRSRQSRPRTGSHAPTTFGFIAVSQTPVRPLLEAIRAQIAKLGFTVALIGSEASGEATAWFSAQEDGHDVVLFVAEQDQSAWIQLCARQVDRIFLVGPGDQPPPAEPFAFADQVFHDHRLMDILLVQPRHSQRPQGAAAWMDAAPASRIFHLRQGDPSHIARMARVLTGTSVGLVLSGGGARAYAHLGVVKALREAGVPIDFIGGASMGAIIGAGLAAGWSLEKAKTAIRKAFVASNPLSDIALPMIAMTRGKLVHDRLKESFGDTDIEDLWLPFYCVSSNLTTGEPYLHRRGSLRHALRASSSLPGVLPPVIWEASVLVDGAVTNNLPTDIMRRWHRGPVVGIDVAEARALRIQDVEPPKSILRWVLSGDWKKGPPIVSLLIRAATVSNAHDRAPILDACDLLVAPNIEGVELRDWKAFEPAVEAGYRAMKAALEELEVPLVDLCRPERRRPV
ncbi:MAG: patatin-like phospholipase family protein [Caulobacteraceae bacterium]